MTSFKQFLLQKETNVPGGMADYVPGAALSSNFTGTEVQSDARGMVPSTDLGIVSGYPRTGTISQIFYNRNPIRILYTTDGEKGGPGKTHELIVTRDEFANIKPMPKVGRRITVINQGNTDKVDRIIVYGA